MSPRRIAIAVVFSLLPLLGDTHMTFEEAQVLLDSGKYVKVLDYALEEVRRNPKSFEGLYLLGVTLHRGEGNLPLALRRLQEAKQVAEERGGYNALDPDKQRVYLSILNELIWIDGESERYQEQLDLVALVKRETGQDWSYESGWPLMKLHRYDEARALMQSKLSNEDPMIRATAMNTLGAIECTTGNLEAGYEWFSRLVNDEAAAKGNGMATSFSNRAEAGLSLLRFGDAENDWLESSKHFSSGSYSNPWSDLTLLYAGEGKLPLAIDAAHRMRDWDHSSDATIEQHRWNLDTRITSTVLLAVGHDRPALDALEMLLRRPDRQGSTTSDPVEAEICLLAVYDEALRSNRERALEGMTWSKPTEWFARLWDTMKLTMEDWATRSRLRALVMDHKSLEWVLRPYSQDSTIPEWMRPAVANALGEGMAAAKLREMLRRTDADSKREKPYYEEFLGELEARGGNRREGIDLLTAATRDLPQEEAILLARAHAVLADALERTGKTDAARQQYVHAFDLDPQVFRSLGLSVPVRIRSDNDWVSKTAASWLAGSPRFRSGDVLELVVTRTADGMAATLEDSTGTVFGRAESKVTKDPKESARLLCDTAQSKLFAPRVNFEQADLDSLDGSPMTGSTEDTVTR